MKGEGEYDDSFKTHRRELTMRWNTCFWIRFWCGQTSGTGVWRTMGKFEIVLGVRQNVIEM